MGIFELKQKLFAKITARKDGCQNEFQNNVTETKNGFQIFDKAITYDSKLRCRRKIEKNEFESLSRHIIDCYRLRHQYQDTAKII